MNALAPPQTAPCKRDGGGQFVFHLDEDAADGGNARREALDDFGGRSDGITGGEARARSQRAFAAGMVAIQEM